MDIVESVLLTDPRYVQRCNEIDELLETKTIEELEELTEEAENPLRTTDVDEALEEDDIIDRDVSEYIDVMNSISSADDEDIIDYFISKGGARIDD